MTNASPPPEHSAAGLSHILSPRVLLSVFAALVIFTIATVVVSRLNLGRLNLYVALAVASVKALLVVAYFMHLRYDKPFNLLIFLGCLVFVVLFISLALTDTQAYQSTLNAGKAPKIEHTLLPAAEK